MSELLQSRARRTDAARDRVDAGAVARPGRPEPAGKRDPQPRRQRARRHAGGRQATIETANAYLDEHYSAAHAEVRAGQICRGRRHRHRHGMPKDTLARVFEPFFTTKEVGQGHRARPSHGLRLRQAVGRPRQDLQRARRRHDGEDLSAALHERARRRTRPRRTKRRCVRRRRDHPGGRGRRRCARLHRRDPARARLPRARGARRRGGAAVLEARAPRDRSAVHRCRDAGHDGPPARRKARRSGPS